MIELFNDFSSSAWSAVVYGPAGIGKTSFAVRAPKAVVINLENGLKAVDLSGSGAVATNAIESVDEFWKVLEWFGGSEYQTCVIDSLTRLEALYEPVICKATGERDKKAYKSYADIPFGRGSVSLATEFGVLIEYIDQLKRAGKNVIMLAHTKVATVNDPENDNYETFDLALDKKVVERIKAASDYVWFMHQERSVKTDERAKVGRSTVYNRVLIQTKQSGGVQAKTRGNMEMFIEVKNDNSAKDIWNGL